MKGRTKETVPEINQQLRAWTRGTTFTLQMGKTQVATLVAIHVAQREWIGYGHPMLRNWVVAVRGLETRGLVARVGDSWESLSSEQRMQAMTESLIKGIRASQAITPAGVHVISLLKLTGIYYETRTELLSVPVFGKGEGRTYHFRLA